ncbi:tRNA-splicing endonuclease subunit sen54 [Cryomyces antarcticus]|uniref:tRNA-splicing endonuclease subunit sen54 n=1 Tax=Cryomyces antarcticus TaxID=329879 RepID=A0ABR0M861_9PEZI|nr:tRNA-splicing endonuclease subunit sen54 [Cryomyces antarcticus]
MASEHDEDALPSLGLASAAEDDASSDEDGTLDYTFLAKLSLSTSTSAPKIPKRGTKDFEPNSTRTQTSALASSRDAMHTALSVGRVHLPKAHVYAVYDAESCMAYVDRVKGQHFKTMGRDVGEKGGKGSRLWLLPEECLYLLERGTLDVRWPVDEADGGGVGGEGEQGEEQQRLGVPMSLQGAYAAFIGLQAEKGGALTFERYAVYAYLKRAGYTVLRASSWDGPGDAPEDRVVDEQLPARYWNLGLFAEIWKNFFSAKPEDSTERQRLGPLVTPGLYRSYADIYRLLALIPAHDPALPPSHTLTEPPFRVTYNVYKPNAAYKKSAPGPPDFRIAVINARETPVPSLDQLTALLNSTPYDPPRPGAQLYQKVRQGYRNVVLAVVDQGVVSYLRIADAGMASERLYERTGGAFRGKRGGYRGRGRGRGRGR